MKWLVYKFSQDNRDNQQAKKANSKITPERINGYKSSIVINPNELEQINSVRVLPAQSKKRIIYNRASMNCLTKKQDKEPDSPSGTV